MVRALIELAGGAIAGCVAVFLLSGAAGTFTSFGPETAGSRIGPDLDGRAELRDLISELAAGPASVRRDIELADLLFRIAEPDPAQAIELAQDEYLEIRFFEPLYEAWARVDPEAALASVRDFGSPVERRKIGIAVLRGFDNDPDGIARVLDSLGDVDPLGFEIDALIDRAERDPSGALQVLFAADRNTTELLLFREVIRQAALSDPVLTLNVLEGSDESAYFAFQRDAMTAWAAADPDAALTWLADADTSQTVLDETFFLRLAEFDHDRLLGMIDTLPPDAHDTAVFGIARSLANTDAAAAAELFATAYSGSNAWTYQLLRDIGRNWGRQDSERALAWAEEQATDPQAALSGVLQGIVDSDIGLAISMLDRLAPETQAELLVEIARQQAATDLPAAIALVDQFSGQPGYSDAQSVIIRELAHRDPAAAASLLQETDPGSNSQSTTNPFSSVAVLVDNWMSEDRSSLLNWAARLEQPELKASAMHWIAAHWADTDADGARQWLPSVSPGPARDAALNSYLMTRADAGEFEAGLLDSFSSRAAAEGSASDALIALARREREEAERLANAYLTDEAIRQNTLQRIGRLW